MAFLDRPLSLIGISTASRKVAEIDVSVIISESTTDALTITKHPVQTGASISDHAYKEPVVLSMTILGKDNPTKSLAELYEQYLDLQTKREPFIVTTPKRQYRNLLLMTIGSTTDRQTEAALSLTLTFQEVILVPVSPVTIIPNKVKTKGRNEKTNPAGKKSAALKTFGGNGFSKNDSGTYVRGPGK